MRHCNSCGGVIGRDCFNPVECAYISYKMQQNHFQEMEIAVQQQLNKKFEEQTETARQNNAMKDEELPF